MKKIVKNNYLLFLVLLLFGSFVFIECFFRLMSGQVFFSYALIRIFAYNLLISFLIGSLLSLISWKKARYITIIIIFIAALYAAIQLGYHDYMGYFLSIRMASYGIYRVRGYIVDFLQYLSPTFFFSFLPLILIVFFARTKHFAANKMNRKTLLVFLSGIVLLSITYFGSLLLKNKHQVSDPLTIYTELDYSEEGVLELGLNSYLSRDIYFLLFPKTSPTILEEKDRHQTEQPEVPEDNQRIIDDSLWEQLIEEETNKQIQIIDDYLINKPIAQKNEMTGMFEGKNIIYIMVEAFDYTAINEHLTPTLYKMTTEGWWFDYFYSPQFSCATGESEFIGINSLVPDNATCVPNNFSNNTYSSSIFNLFKDSGYYVSSYHNWDDQFYPRNTLHQNYRSEFYCDINCFDFNRIQGWQSDLTMMELAVPMFIEEQPFFSFIITSSMHLPYDKISTLGDRYLDLVKEYYPDAPIEIQRYYSKSIEFDKSLEYLLNTLEEQGILEDTVIILYADHHPLKMNVQNLYDYTFLLNRTDYPFSADLTPMIIYNSELEPAQFSNPTSTMDLVPTIANLFDLNYDPRLYMGVDYFDEEENIVLFDNGSWINSQGYYSSSISKFVPNSEEIDMEDLTEVSNKIKNKANISNLIFQTDYFKHRQEIVHPQEK